MRTKITNRVARGVVALALVSSAVYAMGEDQGEFQITAFSGNGQISWDDPGGTGTQYAVQWAGPGLTNWMTWKEADKLLTGLGPSGTAQVPMFYRMVADDPSHKPTESYSYFDKLPPLNPLTPLASNEMRITFMGSMIPLPVRRAQAEMSIFVEVGWSNDVNDTYYGGRATDQFVFDMGAGASANYAAAKVGYRRMDKIFVNHLHGDHTSDILHTYCFGPSSDRKSPLYIWGSCNSGVESPPASGTYYDDGVAAFCYHLRQAMRWHTESFSFQGTRYAGYVPPTKESWGLPHDLVPVADDDPCDAYAIVPIELEWWKLGGLAYSNAATRAKVTHFPVIHCRKGAMGYKLEWQTPDNHTLTMVYTSDTKPETNSIVQANNNGAGVDVFIHEMVVPPSVWAYRNMGLYAPPEPNDPLYAEYQATVQGLQNVQNSSHTTQGAFGYLMSQMQPRPKLTVATHFPVDDTTVASAFQSVAAHVPGLQMGKDIIWSFDLLVLRVFPERIDQYRAEVSDYSFNPPVQLPSGVLPPKYHDAQGHADPYAQIDESAAIPPEKDGEVNYRVDGF